MGPEKIWAAWSAKTKEHFIKFVLPRSRYAQYLNMYKENGIADLDSFKSVAAWYREFGVEKERFDDKEIEKELMHSKPYWYDESRDVYIVHLPNKHKPFLIKGEMWRAMVDSYSNWSGSNLTVNQMCRKFSLSRKTITQLIRFMGLTHDSAPFTDEVLAKENEETLIEDMLRKKEESVLLKVQQLEWRKINRDANRYRVYAKFCESIKYMFSSLNVCSSLPKIEYSKHNIGKYVLLLSPTDFHWGKYGPSYTKDEYNRKIAHERLFSSTEKLFYRIKNRSCGMPSRLVLAIGGDGMHIDNQSKGTTRGTPQDCDGTPSEIASSYVKLCVEYISYIKHVCPVQVFVVQGNHDFYTSAILREAIIAWFRNDSDVDVFESLSTRQTILYGNSLITFMHGDEGTVKDYPTIIASENAEIFGKSKWRFIFTGHLHTERELPQWGDTTVYRMPSLAGTDDWHYRKGYKSRKALIGYIISEEEGVIGQEIVPVLK